jgi:hypothetical protein
MWNCRLHFKNFFDLFNLRSPTIIVVLYSIRFLGTPRISLSFFNIVAFNEENLEGKSYRGKPRGKTFFIQLYNKKNSSFQSKLAKSVRRPRANGTSLLHAEKHTDDANNSLLSCIFNFLSIRI